MHKIALLQSNNWILREQNKVLSKPHRAKKIHLQQGESMTLAEGQGIQTQIDVEAQLKKRKHIKILVTQGGLRRKNGTVKGAVIQGIIGKPASKM